MSGESEDEIIRNYLNDLQDELSISFAEKKQQMGVQENIEDEMMTLVEEINNKEEQLKQLVDLSNIVLTKKIEYEREKILEIENMEQALVSMETELEIQKQTANQYQRLYQDSLDKNNDLQCALQSVEEQLHSKDSQHTIMKNELLNLKQMEMQMGSVEEQKQLLLKLQSELKLLEEENNQYKTEIKDLRLQQKDLLQNYKVSFEGLQKQQYENKNLKQNLTKLENKMQDTKISIEQYQEMIQVQKQENEILFNKQLEYEDEIRALQNKSKIQEQQLLINQSTLGKTLTGNNPNPSYFSNMDQQSEIKEYNFEDTHGTLDSKVVKKKKVSKSRKPSTADAQSLLKDSNQKLQIQQEQQQSQQQSQQLQQSNEQQQQTQQKNQSKLQIQEKKQKQKLKTEKGKQIIKTLKNSKNNVKKPDDKFQKYKVPPPIKRDPYEEFFELIVQAVKLNSPYMDDILGINTKNWYKQVVGELIPFHKWYQWVNDKIHGIRNELIKSREKSLLYSKRTIIF